MPTNTKLYIIYQRFSWDSPFIVNSIEEAIGFAADTDYCVINQSTLELVSSDGERVPLVMMYPSDTSETIDDYDEIGDTSV